MIQTEMLSPVQYDFTIHFLIILPLLTHTHTPNGQQNSCATCMYKLAYLSLRVVQHSLLPIKGKTANKHLVAKAIRHILLTPDLT